jgi:hypothetical protein
MLLKTKLIINEYYNIHRRFGPVLTRGRVVGCIRLEYKGHIKEISGFIPSYNK